MNNLSWFLYLAGVSENLSIVIFIMGFLIIFPIIVLLLGDPKEHMSKAIFLSILLFMFFVVGALLPSKNTMYAIAASEIGEEALQSNIGKRSVEAIEKWIDSQLKE